MKVTIGSLLEKIEKLFTCIEISFDDEKWCISVPARPGIYIIETNAPAEVLHSLGEPLYPAHINIPRTFNEKRRIIEYGLAITQKADGLYTIYNGEAQNLKARARDHVRGHARTFCLGLKDYPRLRDFRWRFCFVASSLDLDFSDKAFRLLIEQAWRVKHGWPLLCRK